MKVISQNLIGTTQEWKNNDPVLPKAVWGFEETDSGVIWMKIGDGVKRWSELPYFTKTNIKELPEGLAEIKNISDEMQTAITAEAAARAEADQALQQAIDAEVTAREEVVTAEAAARAEADQALQEQINVLVPEGLEELPLKFERLVEADQALQQAIDAEAQTREQADQALQQAIDTEAMEREAEDVALREDFNAWTGIGGKLTAYNFGVAIPEQTALTDYALSQITSISSYLQIWNGTKIKNLFDNHNWHLTNTQNTNPPQFEWTDQGIDAISPFAVDRGGYIIGANNNDPPEYVIAQLNGKGKVDLPAIKTLIKNEMFDEEYPIGDIVVQHPSTKSPLEKGWRGTWVAWNLPKNTTQGNPLYNPNQIGATNSTIDIWNRPVLYGLVGTSYYPSPSTYDEQSASVIAANAYRTVTHADGDQAIYQAIAQIPLINDSNSPYNGKIGPFDPVKWRELKDHATSNYRPIFVPREDITGHSWTTDHAIGATVTYNNTSYRVVARHGLGGKFLSGHGGNRPPFESGGVHGDAIRNINGSFDIRKAGSNYDSIYEIIPPFSTKNSTGGTYASHSISGNYMLQNITFDARLVVPTAQENSPRTLSVIYWRRIS